MKIINNDGPGVQGGAERSAWLIDNALIPPALVRELSETFPPDGELARRLLHSDARVGAYVWLVTHGRKRNYACFAGLDLKTQTITPPGQLALGAMLALPDLVTPVDGRKAPAIFASISSLVRLSPVVDHVLGTAPDGERVCFLGDVAGELDGHDWNAMNALGRVRVPVTTNEAGWPVEWRPFA